MPLSWGWLTPVIVGLVIKRIIDEAKTHVLEWVSSYEKSSNIGWIGWTYA